MKETKPPADPLMVAFAVMMLVGLAFILLAILPVR